MAGYTRQSSYTDGDVITAAHSNDEFNQILAAFVNTTGHKHDGTAAEGPVIGLIGDPGVATPINKVVVDDTNNRVGVFVDVSGSTTEQVRFQDGVIVPATDNDIDLGTNSLEFKDLFLDGTATIDTLQVDESATITANLTVNGNTTLGNAASDTVTITADVASDIIPSADNTHDLGASGSEWKDLYIDGVAYVDSIAMPTTTVTDILDEDNMASDSAAALATQQSIKAYVDSQVTAQDLDFQGDSGGALSIDLDSETLTIAGGTGIDTTGSGNTLTVDIDSTVATLAGTQTLTNKTIDVDNNTVSNIEVDNLKSGVLDTDLSSVAATDTTLASAKAIKTYVDAQVTAQDLDFQADSGGALSIDLDSESLTFTGGTGIDTSGSGNAVTFAIDSTVATLTGTQTLTNKSIDAGQLTGTVANARLDQQLQDVAGLAATDGNFIVGDGTNFVAESGATARTSLGLGTAATSASTDFVAVTGDDVTGDINFGDRVALNFGAGTDFSLEHNDVTGKNTLSLAASPLEIHQTSSNGTLQLYRDTGDGVLLQFFGGTTRRGHITTDSSDILTVNATGDFAIRVNDGEIAADFTADGAAKLYYDTSAKLATKSTGVTVTGEMEATSIASTTTATTQAAGTNNTTIATTAFAATVASNEAVALAIALG